MNTEKDYYTYAEGQQMEETIERLTKENEELKKKWEFKKKKARKISAGEIDVFHYHEVIDRLYLLGFIGDTFLMEHPVFQLHPEAREKLENALKEFAELYQMLGAIEFTKFENEKS